MSEAYQASGVPQSDWSIRIDYSNESTVNKDWNVDVSLVDVGGIRFIQGQSGEEPGLFYGSTLPVTFDLIADASVAKLVAPILRLYQAYFDRQPDLAGAKYWLDVRRSGYR